MSWAIRIPYRSREDSLAEVGFAARQLDAEERAIVRALVLQAALGDCRTAGDLLDRVGRATVAERRVIYDNAREAAGLERSQDIDDRERFEEAQREARRQAPPVLGGAIPCCAVCGCMPAGPDGMPVPINAKTWHCPQHEHLAGEGDMAAPTDVQVVDANFMLWPSPSEIAREQARDDRRREARRQRAEAGAVETAERAAQQAAAERRFISELPPGLRP